MVYMKIVKYDNENSNMHKKHSDYMSKYPKNWEIVVLCERDVASFSKEKRFSLILYTTKKKPAGNFQKQL